MYTAFRVIKYSVIGIAVCLGIIYLAGYMVGDNDLVGTLLRELSILARGAYSYL